jgi:ERCC4-related helicase
MKSIYDRYIEELKIRKVLYGPPSKTRLLKLQQEIMSSLKRGNQNFNYMLAASACAQAIKVQHSLELLETQTLQSYLHHHDIIRGHHPQDPGR